MKGKAVVLGGSGMLGMEIVQQLKSNNWDVKTISRSSADINVDVSKKDCQLAKILMTQKPDLVINCAAMVSLAACEQHPKKAMRVNGLVLEDIIEGCKTMKAKVVHISTDHWYENDGKKLHREDEDIKFANQYARSKYIGEAIALQESKSLVIRTNITGFRGNAERPTFIEWLMKSLIENQQITLYKDFYTSTISCRQLSWQIVKAVEKDTSGILNIASQESISKLEFGILIAKAMGKSTNNIKEGTVENMSPKRANSLGLNTEKACRLLGTEMPDTSMVINDLLSTARLKS